MEEKYVYLMHASSAVCRLSQQRLKQAGIESKIEDYLQNAFFRLYGATPLLGEKVTVPKSKLAEAKELLNITGEENDGFSFSNSKHPLYKFVRMIIILYLLVLFLYILLVTF